MPSPPRPSNVSPSTPATTQPPATKPSAPPVSILPSQLAKAYSFIHPVLLLALLATRFSALVADPVTELLNSLLPLALLQLTYVVVCVPPAGSVQNHLSETVSPSGSADSDEKKKTAGASSASPGSTAATGSVRRAGKVGYRRRTQSSKGYDIAGVWARLIPAILSLTLTTLLATPILSILLVLFGAPLTTHNFETVLCAAHMAALTAIPLIYVHGVDGTTWKEVWGVSRPADTVWGGALGMGLGAWLGAVPIPLDWDRPWQAFPITIVTGAYLGFVVGSLVSRTGLLFGKRIHFTPEEYGEHSKTE